MMSTRLKWLLGVTSVLFLLHVLEEFALGFHEVDVVCRWVCRHIVSLSGGGTESVFAVFQVMLVVLVGLVFVLCLGDRTRLVCTSILGVIMVGELQHVAESLRRWTYHPGTASGISLAVVGVLLLREVRSCWTARSKP